MKNENQTRTAIMTTTGELFLPTRLVYTVHDAKQLQARLTSTNCMDWDEERQRWVWLHAGAALKLKFPPAYAKIPKEHRPVVLATCYPVDNQTFHVYTRCALRAAKFLAFFDRLVSRDIAMGIFVDKYNLITDVLPGETFPIPEDYFRDESKIEFFDLTGLLDSPDSPAKEAALRAYFDTIGSRTWVPLNRHRLEDFYEDGPLEFERSCIFREAMARLQYESDTPICPVAEITRMLALPEPKSVPRKSAKKS